MCAFWDTRPVVGVLLFDQVEVLDFAGPYEVLCCAVDERGKPLFRVFTLAENKQVTCRGGLKVAPDKRLSAAPGLDVVLVPGGPGARSRKRGVALVKFLRERADTPAHIASVCTGAFVLARAGLLDGKKATTHWARRAELARAHPKVEVVEGKVVDQGKVITSAGVASGIDLALHLVEKYYGQAARSREAKRLEGPWR